MSDTAVLTYIYNEFWGTEQFRKSVDTLGLPLYNALNGTQLVETGLLLKRIYEGYVKLREDGYKKAIYSDGADTYFVKTFDVPDDKIIYSAEKAVWPPTDEMKRKWEHYYHRLNYNSNIIWGKDFKVSSWKYLNGGNCCGPIDLIIEFFEKYGILEHEGKECNGQGIVAEAFLKAKVDGFPIELDTNCEYFQTTGFAELGELGFDVSRMVLQNFVTNTEPAVAHGNGRTDMKWIYERFK